MRVVIILILIVLAFTAPADLTAKVFYAKDEAIRAAFPEATSSRTKYFF